MNEIVDLSRTLEDRIAQFEKRVSSSFSTIDEYAKFEDPLKWLDLKLISPDKDNVGYLRRLSYVYGRVIESLKEVSSFEDKSENIKDVSNSFPLNEYDPSKLKERYQAQYRIFSGEINEFDRKVNLFRLADVVRRLKVDAELAPLRVSNVDTELFTAIYVYICVLRLI